MLLLNGLSVALKAMGRSFKSNLLRLFCEANLMF